MTKRILKKSNPTTPIDAMLQIAEALRVWNPDGSEPLDDDQLRARAERDRIVAKFALQGHEDALSAALAEALAEVRSASRTRSAAGDGDGGKRSKIDKLEKALAKAVALMDDGQVHNRLVAAIGKRQLEAANQRDVLARFVADFAIPFNSLPPETGLMRLRIDLRQAHNLAESARAIKGNPGKALRRDDQDAAAGPLIAFWENHMKLGTVHRKGGGVSSKSRDGSEGSTSRGRNSLLNV